MKNRDDIFSGMLLNQLAHLGQYQVMKRTESLGITPSQAGILFALAHEGGLSQKELSRRIGITPPSITAALRKLEGRSYIVRRPDENDQRVIRIWLTEKGSFCLKELRHVLSEADEILYQGFSTEERMLMKRLLLEMRENLLKSKEFRGMDMDTVMEQICQKMKCGI